MQAENGRVIVARAVGMLHDGVLPQQEGKTQSVRFIAVGSRSQIPESSVRGAVCVVLEKPPCDVELRAHRGRAEDHSSQRGRVNKLEVWIHVGVLILCVRGPTTIKLSSSFKRKSGLRRQLQPFCSLHRPGGWTFIPKD